MARMRAARQAVFEQKRHCGHVSTPLASMDAHGSVVGSVMALELASLREETSGDGGLELNSSEVHMDTPEEREQDDLISLMEELERDLKEQEQLMIRQFEEYERQEQVGPWWCGSVSPVGVASWRQEVPLSRELIGAPSS